MGERRHRRCIGESYLLTFLSPSANDLFGLLRVVRTGSSWGSLSLIIASSWKKVNSGKHSSKFPRTEKRDQPSRSSKLTGSIPGRKKSI